jgi:preprotein translocase subunit YajC
VQSLEALLPFIIILLAFWLLIIRPARNRQRQQAQLQHELAPGQQVMTTSGLIARILAVEDDVVLLEAAPGVTLRWAKPAIARILPTEEGRPGDDGGGATTQMPD